MPGPLTPLDRSRLERISARLERNGPLEMGDSGPAVRAMEGALRALGFTPGKSVAQFDGFTRGTVKNFQQSMGLEQSGTFDRQTLAAMRDALVRKRDAPDAIRRGQKSDEIAQVERQLKLLGYDPGRPDAISDGALAKAVARFKADQGIDNRTGFMSTQTQAMLSREAAGMRHAAWHGRRDLTANQKREDGVLAELSHHKNPDGTVGIGEGGHRPAIEQLQTRLRAAGFNPKRSDGVFDERTRGALEAFQRSTGVKVTGRLDPATWKKLKGAIIDTDKPASPAQRVNERSGAVHNTEKLLARAGFRPGKIDGLYTRQTARAVRLFERRNHRHVDGQLGPRDLVALKRAARTNFPRPEPDYSHHSWRNVVANGRTIEMVNQAERWAKKRGVSPGWPMFQGSYNAGGVAGSEGTHDGGGALDVNVESKSPHQIHVMVEALRRAGFAAWHRPWEDDHIHAVAIGDRDLSSEARGQVFAYFHHLDGLSPPHRDPHGDIGLPIPAWAKKFRRAMT